MRFVCPAITAPHYYGLLKEPPNAIAQRQLVLIAKVLQNLANLANTKKEAFMESMLDFIDRNKPKMIQYYKSLLVSIDVSVIHRLFLLTRGSESRGEGKSTHADESVCSFNSARKFLGLLAHPHLS